MCAIAILDPSPTPDSRDPTKPQAASRDGTLKPRDRLVRHGPEALNDSELVSLLFRQHRGRSALEVAGSLVQDAGGLTDLMSLDYVALRHRGLSEAKAVAVLTVAELSRRQARQTVGERLMMTKADEVARYIHLQFGKVDQEVMGVLLVDMRNGVLGEVEVFRGTLTRAAVEPRAILRHALLRHAAGIFLFHTHPGGGSPEPSKEDRDFTRRMVSACELLGIRLLDHLIIGVEGTWVSMKKRFGL